jgi:hypothetical protein
MEDLHNRRFMLEIIAMAKYSLYELIKDKLSPNTRKKLELQMQRNQANKKEEKESEDF